MIFSDHYRKYKYYFFYTKSCYSIFIFSILVISLHLLSFMFLKTVIHMGKNNVLEREISTTDLTICFKHCHGTMMIESLSE